MYISTVIYGYLCTYIFKNIFMFCSSIHSSQFLYIYIYIYICVCVCVCAYVCVHVCVYFI